MENIQNQHLIYQNMFSKIYTHTPLCCQSTDVQQNSMTEGITKWILHNTPKWMVHKNIKCFRCWHLDFFPILQIQNLIFISWFMSNARHKVKLQYLLSQGQYQYNMINKINKERQYSMNTTPIRPSNKNQRQGVQADPKQKQDRAQDLV
jgi:hypothetical protein